MARAKASSSKANSSVSTSESIRQQTEEFLNSGGLITVVATGTTGYNSQRGSKHITINSSKNK